MKQSLAKSMVLATIILMDVLVGMEFDIFVPSFPELQNHFTLTPFWVESLLSVNFTGLFLSLFFVGGLADRYGRKPMILLGLMTFIIGSLLCIRAPSMQVLLFGRFIQGIGISAPAILSFLIISDTYPLKRQQSLFSILNGLLNISAGAAPVLGSYITLYFHWQGNFMTLLTLGLLTFILTMLFIPNYKLPEHKESILLRGYFSIFKSKTLLLLMVFFIFNFVPYWVFVGMSPILYMEDLGVTLTHFGYYQGVLAFVYAIGSLSFGLIVNRYDQKKLLYVSAQIFILSLISIGLASVLNSPSPLFIILAFLPFIIGQIIPGTILYPFCLSLMPHAKGRITALLQGGRLVFSAFCLQIAGYFYQRSFQNIGLIICVFILLTIIALFFVIRNQKLMKALNAST